MLDTTAIVVGFLAYQLYKGWKGGTKVKDAPWPKEGAKAGPQPTLQQQAQKKWERMTPKQKAAAHKAAQGEAGHGTDEEALLRSLKNK